ncbi:MAG: (2Fe-2S)-binding protein [Dehalococcoidia bacterium]|jgi:carbon-monoxide dehydrogenase small subunit|nr:(2Fe-2S)-binding protein [Dehalococcoidia bacterium]|tara:strand:- start:1508 stop:1984 length:477 start_codon:yes stop_codon:yes gene_type:complete
MSKKHIKTTVNDIEHEILVDSTWTLLETLRDHLGLTGTKEGCSNGNCGACTVMIDGKSSCSCLVLAPEIDNRKVTTVEGLADHGHLSPVQDAFVENSGLQCGFCTPGFIIAATTLLNENPHPTENEIRLKLAGNLCRCTGYDKIIRSVQDAAERLSKS